MKNFLTTFLAVLLAAGLSLFAYDRLVLAPRLQAAGDAAKLDLTEAREEADRIAGELDSRVGQTVSGARVAFDTQVAEEDQRRADLEAQAERIRASSQAAEAMARVSMLRVGLSEIFVSNGAWPATLAEVGMGESDDFAGGAVAGVALEPEGVIVIRIRPEVAAGGELRLVPTVKPSGIIDWKCKARDYPAASLLEFCKG